MEKQVKPCQGDKKHTPLSNLIFQGRVRSFRRKFNKLRCQAQALKVASVYGSCAHPEEVSDRTPTLVLSVVHTTERPTYS
jgi:hypothetical protein